MRRKVLSFVVVYGISIGCLVWVFRGVDFGELERNLRVIRWPYLLCAAFLNAAAYFANAFRWEILLAPVTRVRYLRSLQAIYIGLFINDVLPLRPGEIIRCGLLSRWTRLLNLTVAISSAMIERLFEFAWLAAAFFVLVVFVPVPKSLVYGCSVATGIVLAGCGLLMLKVRQSRIHRGQNKEGKLVCVWHQLVDGLHLMANGSTIAAVTGMSLVSLLMYILASWIAMKSCLIVLPLAIAAAAVIIIRVGTAIPTTPGSVGAYQFFTVLALRLFGVSKTAAATFTVVAFAAFSFPLLIGGAVAFVLTGTDFAEILSLWNQPSKNVPVDTHQ